MRHPLAAALITLACTGALARSNECAGVDWYRQGQRDGAAGRPAQTIDNHREACRQTGISPDTERWQQGWQAGLARYCVPAAAWREGLKGARYAGVCADRDEARFLEAFRAAEQVHRAERDFGLNAQELRKLRARLAAARGEEERRGLRDRIDALQQEQARLRALAADLRRGRP